MSRKKIFFLITIFFAGLLASCSQNKFFQVPAPLPDDTQNVPQPEANDIHAYAEYFEKQVILQIDEAVDLARQYRNITGTRKSAENIDAFGEVPNSSWFTNRNAINRMSLGDIARGPNTGNGPDTSGLWTVIRAKAEGVTPGFTIRDAKGDLYLIKFDPPGYPELASGAEVVSTKLFYAAGYNTPENYIVYFHPDNLRLGEKVKFTDKKGRDRFMTKGDLNNILSEIETLPNGKMRALASKYLEGVPIGPFQYKGIRDDDYNDFIPHHHRRELRGLRIISAWLNHYDTKDGNSLDMYVTENNKSYVKHFLIDFGATLGSATHGPNPAWRGHQHDVDPVVIMENIATLGMYVRPWEKIGGVKYPSVGLYYSEFFNPMDYKPQVPNPAFENMTLLDGYWAAKIVMSFTDEQIETVVEQGQYSNPKAKAYLSKTIQTRRDIIGKYFFSRVNPLDHFRLMTESDELQYLKFIDLAIKYDFEAMDNTQYEYQTSILTPTEKKTFNSAITDQNKISLQPLFEEIKSSPLLSRESLDQLQVQIVLRTKHGADSDWKKKIYVYLSIEGEKFNLVGLKRED